MTSKAPSYFFEDDWVALGPQRTELEPMLLALNQITHSFRHRSSYLYAEDLAEAKHPSTVPISILTDAVVSLVIFGKCFEQVSHLTPVRISLLLARIRSSQNSLARPFLANDAASCTPCPYVYLARLSISLVRPLGDSLQTGPLFLSRLVRCRLSLSLSSMCPCFGRRCPAGRIGRTRGCESSAPSSTPMVPGRDVLPWIVSSGAKSARVASLWPVCLTSSSKRPIGRCSPRPSRVPSDPLVSLALALPIFAV